MREAVSSRAVAGRPFPAGKPRGIDPLRLEKKPLARGRGFPVELFERTERKCDTRPRGGGRWPFTRGNLERNSSLPRGSMSFLGVKGRGLGARVSPHSSLENFPLKMVRNGIILYFI